MESAGIDSVVLLEQLLNEHSSSNKEWQLMTTIQNTYITENLCEHTNITTDFYKNCPKCVNMHPIYCIHIQLQISTFYLQQFVMMKNALWCGTDNTARLFQKILCTRDREKLLWLDIGKWIPAQSLGCIFTRFNQFFIEIYDIFTESWAH